MLLENEREQVVRACQTMQREGLVVGTAGNVSIRVNATERPDTWEVQGRGELQLANVEDLLRARNPAMRYRAGTPILTAPAGVP